MRSPTLWHSVGAFTIPLAAILGAAPAAAEGSCEAPLVTIGSPLGGTTAGSLGPGESDFYDFDSDENTFAYTLVAAGGRVTVWVYEDCAWVACGFGGGIFLASIGGGACWGDGFNPTAFEVRYESSPGGGPIAYTIHVDDCPDVSINLICLI